MLRFTLTKLFSEAGLTKKEAGFLTGVIKMLHKKDNILKERVKQICSESLGFKKHHFLVKIRALIVRSIYSWCDVVYEGLADKPFTTDFTPEINSKSRDINIVEVDYVKEKYLWGDMTRGLTHTRKKLSLKSGDIIFPGVGEDGYTYTVLRPHNHFPYHNC